MKSLQFLLLQAVDSGRRSGHGRVVYLYFDLCEKIWGGSPATEQMDTGLETTEIETEGVCASDNTENEQSASNQEGLGNLNHHDAAAASVSEQPTDNGISCSQSSEPLGSQTDLLACNQTDLPANSQSVPASNQTHLPASAPTSSQSTPASSQSTPASSQTTPASSQSTSQTDPSNTRRGRKRTAAEINAAYKEDKLKKKVAADKQMIHFAEEELGLKKRMAERMETMDKEHRDVLSSLTNNLKSLSDTMASTFSLLQNSLQPSMYNPYQHQYGPLSHYSAASPHVTPPRNMYQTPPVYSRQGHHASQLTGSENLPFDDDLP